MSLLLKINQDSLAQNTPKIVQGQQPQYHYITLQNNKKEEVSSWYENSVIISFVFPAIVTLLTLWFTRFINKKKYNAEIEKINTEVGQLKKSFQPVIVSTLQAVQSNVIGNKIDGLKRLLKLKSNFLTWDYLEVEGDPVLPKGDDFLISVYEHFTASVADDYIHFHEEYAYLYSDKALELLEELLTKMEDLQEDHFQFYNYHESREKPVPESISLVKSIIALYNRSIAMVRTDCLLDNDYIHDFIETYKNDPTTT